MTSTFSELLDIELPLVQAPIGSATCPELAAAVSNAGGLGMLAASWRSTSDLRLLIQRTRTLTNRPFGVNVVLEWDQAERVAVCLAGGVRIISTFWGDPASFVQLIHDRGASLVHSVGSVEEATRAAEIGVDVVVAQGFEAGGHVRGRTPLRELLVAVIAAVDPIPVVAAGGIASGREAVELLAMGAAGVWVGTRFLCSREAHVHPVYRNAILSAGSADGGHTVHGEIFTRGWERAPHRVLRNSTVAKWLEAGGPAPGSRPGEGEIVAWQADGTPIERYSDTIPLPGATGEVEALALYAGEGVSRITRVQPAAEIVAEFRDAFSKATEPRRL